MIHNQLNRLIGVRSVTQVMLVLGITSVVGIFLGILKLYLGVAVLGATGTGYLCTYYTNDLSLFFTNALKSEGIPVGGGAAAAFFMIMAWLYIALALFVIPLAGSWGK